MPINVTCKECGKQLVLKDELAGKKGKCPSCGKVLAIPAPSEKKPPAKAPEKKDSPKAAETKAEAPKAKPEKGRECPGCGASLPKGVLICVRCGTNVMTGTKGATTIEKEGILHKPGRLIRTALGFGVAAAIVVFIVLAASKVLTSLKIAGKVLGTEQQVVEALTQVADAESSFKRKAAVDQDGNGVGEYGLLAELANEVRLRNSNSPVTAQRGDMSYTFSTGGKEGDGTTSRWGYRFRILLATPGNSAGDDSVLAGTPDAPGDTLDDKQAIARQEKAFVCYAWPGTRYANGVHAFVVDQNDKVYCTRMRARIYEGNAGPDAAAAYAEGDSERKLAPGRGSDGNTWAPVPEVNSPAWKTASVTGLIFDLNTPWFTPACVKNPKPIVDSEDVCREAMVRAEMGKKAELQENWQKAELLYKEAVERLGKDSWPEKALARRYAIMLDTARSVLQAAKLESEKKWDEAMAIYRKALVEARNRGAIQEKIARAVDLQKREQAVQEKGTAATVAGAAKHLADISKLLEACDAFGNPYCDLALCEYALGDEGYKGLHNDLQKRKAAAEQKIKADPKTYPPLRAEKGIAFDIVHLKNDKTPLKGQVLERSDITVKIGVTGEDGKVTTRLVHPDDVEKIEKKEISPKETNAECAEEIYVRAVQSERTGRFMDALAALGKLKYYFSDSPIFTDAALQKKLAGRVQVEAPAGEDLSPVGLLNVSIAGGKDRMCFSCLGSGRLRCTHCGGDGYRTELTKCKICDGSGKAPCSECRGTRVRQGVCGTCRGRTTIDCITCKGKGKINPLVQCEACKGTGRTDERCDKCRGTGTNSRTNGPCQACNGTGKVPCPECKGKGNRVADYEITCTECKGNQRITCPNCGASGRAPVNAKCVKCRGKGKLLCSKCKGTGKDGQKLCPLCHGNRQIDCDSCLGTGKPICRECKGTGKETCKTCKGTGKTQVRCKHCDENYTVSCGFCKGAGKRTE